MRKSRTPRISVETNLPRLLKSGGEGQALRDEKKEPEKKEHKQNNDNNQQESSLRRLRRQIEVNTFEFLYLGSFLHSTYIIGDKYLHLPDLVRSLITVLGNAMGK